MLAGFAVSVAVGFGVGVGGGAVADTITLTSASTSLVPSVASTSYSVVADGVTTFDPLFGTRSSSRYTAVALRLVHVSVEDCPG
jgi:hypothetical protein